MPISDSDFRAWLAAEDKDPVILIEAGYYDGSAKTAYWSDAGYIDPTDVDAPNYMPVVLGEIVISESLQSSVPQDVEVFLYDQDILTWQFVGYDFEIWLGDRSWPRADFVKQATSKTQNISAASTDKLRFQFQDLGQIYFDQLVNGNGLGLAAGLPFVFGRVFNFAPLRIASNKFVFFTPAIPMMTVEARDNGVPVTVNVTNNIADGTGDGLRIEVELAAPPAGQLTIDTRRFYVTTPAANSINILLQQMNEYIQIPIPLGATVAAAPTYDVGYVFYQYGTVQQMLNEMCDSMGLNPRINKDGELDLVRVDGIGTPTRIARDANLLSRLVLQSIEPPYKQLELGYQRNWTVQGTDTLAGTVSAANALLFSREYSYDKDTRTLTGYPFVRNQKRETLLYESADAAAELDRRWTLRATEHRVYSVEGDASFIADGIGDTITVMSSDYGFGSGVDVVIISNKKNLTRQRCQSEMWV